MDFRKLDNQWFALQVRSGREEVCAQALGYKGYEQFLPLYCLRRRSNSKESSGLRPLLPGYLFCRFNCRAAGLLVTTPGVIRIVGFGKIPAPVTDEEIENIRSIIASQRPARALPFLQPGHRVRIISGPLCGVEGSLVRSKGARKFIVSIQALSRCVAVELEDDCVVPIHQRPLSC